MALGSPSGSSKRPRSMLEIAGFCLFLTGCLIQATGFAAWMVWAYQEDELEVWAMGLLSAFFQFNTDHLGYPVAHENSDNAFDPQTLEPLLSRGYLSNLPKPGRFHTMTRVLAYENTQSGQDSPSGFWLVLKGSGRRSGSYLVADTSGFPGYENKKLHGVYRFGFSGLTPLYECPEKSGLNRQAKD